ncbi:M1 family metallopeptidase [Thermoanaerobacterium sp. DL9XJH110]|uniref:M1 family metallopeptidase n=1 Tax=Thermoanaerobacterium sp. DL9XJH110 TaxID=3386643 RepID=UPI003BB4F9FD
MKRLIRFGLLLLVLFATVFLIFSYTSATFKNILNSGDRMVKYNSDQRLFPETKDISENVYLIKAAYNGQNRIEAEMELTYINKTGAVLKELYFHLYPNYFSSREKLPFFKEHLDKIYPNGFHPGRAQISEVKQDGRPSDWESLEDSRIVKIPLERPLNPGETKNIYIKFNLVVPEAKYRFGYQKTGDNITVSLGNWYPILAVYKDEHWHLDKYHGIGDPFYSEISDYTVEFTVPKGFTVAASGILRGEYAEDSTVTYVFSAEKVRDFALSVSNNYETVDDMVDGTRIISYFYPRDKKGGMQALDIAKHAVAIFNEYFGKYPYAELRLAEANFYFGGMEYPTFIMIDDRKYREPLLSNTSFERTVAHEVAHQWWYGVVGNDEVNEPWLDEGLAQFSSQIYFEKRYGEAGREAYYNNQIKPFLNTIKKSKKSILDPLFSFSNNTEYYSIIYVKGAMFYEELKAKIGERDLMDFLKSYFETYKYKNVSVDEFVRFLKSKNYPGLDETFYNKWLSKVK